jgi:outer membrane protein assembly factor BamE
MTSFQGYRDINRMDTFKVVHAASIISPRTISKTMRSLLIPACLALLLGGCLSVYKVEVQQGNVVSQDMIDKLKPGMTRSQVRFVLGTPLVTDTFHPNRWDYYYYLRRSKEKTGETRRLTLIFRNDTLVSVQGDKPDATGNNSPRS